MDIVITYVNGLDPVWQKDYEHYTNTPILEKRFRDWGTLQYLFRGIAENMPFIRKVHLIVSGESQVPEWVNREEVNVVLHSDIIPAEFMPTFNSNTIEVCMHRIEGLDEEYLYFNDDMFPMCPCEPTDFFRGGKGVIGMSRHLLAHDMYKKICRNSDRLARKAVSKPRRCWFLRPQHICSPMLRSECEALFGMVEPQIRASMTRVRTEDNLTQYLYLDYMFLRGRIIAERISKKHFSLAVASPEKLKNFIANPSRKMTCINDVALSDERYTSLRSTLIEAFEKRFPTKSKFEK